MDHLRLVWQAGETVLEGVPFQEDPEGTRYNVLLAVQEMVTNVLRHGYRGIEHLPVELGFEVDEEGFRVVIKDRGPEFDPLAVEVNREMDDPFPENEGGYGIMIARMVMDSLEYRRDSGWNVLTMRKLVGVPSGTGHA